MLLDSGDWLNNNLFTFFFTIFLFGFFMWLFFLTDRGRLIRDRFLLNVPIFGAIINHMENGETEALMHHPISVDLESVNLRKIPQTDALADQKLRSLDSVAA